jgi:hypothetical protein
MHIRGSVIDQVNASLHIKNNESFYNLWQFSTFYNKDTHLQIMRICNNCLLLSKRQTTFDTIGAIQVFGSWLSACIRCVHKHMDGYLESKAHFYFCWWGYHYGLPILAKCSCVPYWWLEA